MYIRFQDKHGIGIFQSEEVDYHDIKYSSLFEFLGAITRSPRFYSGMVEGHECLGVDTQFEPLMKDDNVRFAWQYEFFLKAIAGQLTPAQSELANKYDGLTFLNSEKQRKDFINYMVEHEISILLLNGQVEAETEQQAVFLPIQMDYVDELTEDDHYMLSMDALETI